MLYNMWKNRSKTWQDPKKRDVFSQGMTVFQQDNNITLVGCQSIDDRNQISFYYLLQTAEAIWWLSYFSCRHAFWGRRTFHFLLPSLAPLQAIRVITCANQMWFLLTHQEERRFLPRHLTPSGFLIWWSWTSERQGCHLLIRSLSAQRRSNKKIHTDGFSFLKKWR